MFLPNSSTIDEPSDCIEESPRIRGLRSTFINGQGKLSISDPNVLFQHLIDDFNCSNNRNNDDNTCLSYEVLQGLSPSTTSASPLALILTVIPPLLMSPETFALERPPTMLKPRTGGWSTNSTMLPISTSRSFLATSICRFPIITECRELNKWARFIYYLRH